MTENYVNSGTELEYEIANLLPQLGLTVIERNDYISVVDQEGDQHTLPKEDYEEDLEELKEVLTQVEESISKEDLTEVVADALIEARQDCDWPLDCREHTDMDNEAVLIDLFGNNAYLQYQSWDDLAEVANMDHGELVARIQKVWDNLPHDDNAHTLVKIYTREKKDGKRNWPPLKGKRLCKVCDVITTVEED